MYQLSYYFLEIKSRIFYLLLSFILTLITSYHYQFEILYIIGRPFLDLDHKFVLIDLTEAFYSILRICGIISFLLIIPFFLYHFWSFYIPSRYLFERKFINKFSLFFLFLLVLELLLLYFLLFPKLCEFLLSFEIISLDSSFPITKQIENPRGYLQNNTKNGFFSSLHSILDSNLLCKLESKIETTLPSKIESNLDLSPISASIKSPVLLELTARLESYVNLSTRFYFIVLTLFQIPFGIIIFYYYNIIDCYFLCKIRKFFLFSSILISAFISPPDIISQSILAIFLFFFYEFLVFIGIFYSILLNFIYNVNRIKNTNN